MPMSFDNPNSQPVEASKPTLTAGDSLVSPNQMPVGLPVKEATQQLVDKKVLPGLDLTDDHGANTKTAKPEQKDWTVAIDLMSSLGYGQGAEDKLTRMQQLAGETKDKSVAFVVHAEIPDAALNTLNTSDSPNQPSTPDNSGNTQRFLIEDGKIMKLPSQTNADSAQDVTSLLKDASQLAPSKHLGLVLQTHGAGIQGIESNLGDVPLDSTVDAISKGLEGSGHDKLDLLDYDACDMGTVKVLDASKRVANDVVASESVEFASGTPGQYDAQDTPRAMRALLDNSKMSGRDLGDEIVSLPANDIFRTSDAAATPTLANFDLTKFGDFQQSLDNFGAALTKASNDGHAADLAKEVSYTIAPDTGRPTNMAHDRDLREFTQQIANDSSAGSFGDDSSTLNSTANKLLTSMDNMVTSHYSGIGLSGNIGGVTVQMPGSEILDSKRVASEISPLHRLSDDITDIKAHYGVDMPSQQDYVRGITTRLNSLPPGVHTDGNENYQQLIADRDAINGALTLGQLQESFDKLDTDVKAAGQSDLEKDVEEKIMPQVKTTQSFYFESHGYAEGVAPHWDEFGASLQKAEQ